MSAGKNYNKFWLHRFTLRSQCPSESLGGSVSVLCKIRVLIPTAREWPLTSSPSDITRLLSPTDLFIYVIPGKLIQFLQFSFQLPQSSPSDSLTLINTVTAGDHEEESELNLLSFAAPYQLPINTRGKMVAAIGALTSLGYFIYFAIWPSNTKKTSFPLFLKNPELIKISGLLLDLLKQRDQTRKCHFKTKPIILRNTDIPWSPNKANSAH